MPTRSATSWASGRFRSQLLCEQVVGRGLRRRSYAPNEQGRFEPEYADVYGVPFAFIPSDRATPNPKPSPHLANETVYSVPGREHLEIAFPKLRATAWSCPSSWTIEDFDEDACSPSAAANWRSGCRTPASPELRKRSTTRSTAPLAPSVWPSSWLRCSGRSSPEGTFGDDASDGTKTAPRARRPQQPWANVRGSCPRWCVSPSGGSTSASRSKMSVSIGHAAAQPKPQRRRREALRPALLRHASRTSNGCSCLASNSDPPVGSTSNIHFATRKVVVEAARSQLNAVVLDGPKGNSWEESVAGILERHRDVHSYAKNDRLASSIPYVHQGKLAPLHPRLSRPHDPAGRRGRSHPHHRGVRRPEKPRTHHGQGHHRRDQWCVAVNNPAEWGIWAYLQVNDIARPPVPRSTQALDVLAKPLQRHQSEPATDAHTLEAGAH
jgi:type III restriction enzyme